MGQVHPSVLLLEVLDIVALDFGLLVNLSKYFGLDLVLLGDVPGVKGDDDDEVHQGDEGHPEAQTVDCGSHLCLCFLRECVGKEGGREEER